MANLPIIPGRGLMTKSSTQMRLDYLDSCGIKTDKISVSQTDLHEYKNNIESYVGSTEIPLGLVGPLLFNDLDKKELVYCLAGTLEGALISSMNRGAKVLSKSNGFSANVIWQKMTRSPMFIFELETEALILKILIEENFNKIKQHTENYSNHAKLQEITTVVLETVVHLKFVYSTGDASGQNMTTTCTWHAVLFIVEKLKNKHFVVPLDFVLEGNGASDKKISHSNIKLGRGIHVVAECIIPEIVINQILRTSSKKIKNCFLPSQKLALLDGMIGYNINVANAVAAIFVATGQDLASIHESSIGVLHLEEINSGLYLRLTLPNLVIGTIGGGTHLPKQSQALETMKCLGNGKVERFAKLIAGFALGLEISTYAAIVSGEFAKAHEKLGRNKPVQWLSRSELTYDFISTGLNELSKDNKIQSIEVLDRDLIENGILTNIASATSKKLIGFIPIQIKYETKTNETITSNVILKSKPLDEDIIKGLHLISASIDPELSDLLLIANKNLEYNNCHLKELELYTYLDQIGFKNIPVFYGKIVEPNREIYILLQEFLDYSSMKIINSENTPEKWGDKDVLNIIKVISKFHQGVTLSKFETITEFQPWKSAELYKKLLTILIAENQDQTTLISLNYLLSQIDNLEEEKNAIKVDKTIVHNDLNPRNIAIQKNEHAIIYDWELAMIDFPQRDIIEFLSFVLPENFEKEKLFYFLNFHYNQYPNTSWEECLKAYKYSLKIYIISRLTFYEVSGILIKYEFSNRVFNTAIKILYLLNENE